MIITEERKEMYGYIRVSTNTQADRGYGLETQRNALIKHCNDNDYKLVDIFIDKAKSGAMDSDEEDCLDKRPELKELLYSLNGINTIIVMNTSRLWRNDMAKAVICKKVRKYNGEIISIEQPQYSLYVKNPSDLLYNTLLEALDEYERLNINQRLSKGRSTKARQGNKPSGRQPFGYEFDIQGKATIINSRQAKIIRNIFDMRSAGKTYQAIADNLNKKKNTVDKNAYTGANKDRVWSYQAVQEIIRNDFYIGKITHAGEKFDGNHEAIVDIDTWNAIHASKE